MPMIIIGAQPAFPAAAKEALRRASWLAETAPVGPVDITLDAGIQEAVLTNAPPPMDPARFRPAVRHALSPAALNQDPVVDIAGIGRAQRAKGWGPADDAASLEAMLSEAIAEVEGGERRNFRHLHHPWLMVAASLTRHEIPAVPRRIFQGSPS